MNWVQLHSGGLRSDLQLTNGRGRINCTWAVIESPSSSHGQPVKRVVEWEIESVLVSEMISPQTQMVPRESLE